MPRPTAMMTTADIATLHLSKLRLIWNFGIDLARDVVNIDEEQQWTQYCSLWYPGGDVHSVLSFC